MITASTESGGFGADTIGTILLVERKWVAGSVGSNVLTFSFFGKTSTFNIDPLGALVATLLAVMAGALRLDSAIFVGMGAVAMGTGKIFSIPL